MLQSLTELNDQLVSLKAELSDKVHTENVKCFRNIQDLFKVMGDKVDTVSELEKQVGTTKTLQSSLLCWLLSIHLVLLQSHCIYWGSLVRFFNKYYCIGWCSSRLGSCTIF